MYADDADKLIFINDAILKDFVLLTVGLESCPSRQLQLLLPLFIRTGFPPFYRVIDPIARGRYALSIMLMGQF